MTHLPPVPLAPCCGQVPVLWQVVDQQWATVRCLLCGASSPVAAITLPDLLDGRRRVAEAWNRGERAAKEAP